MGKLRNYFLNHYPRTDFHELNQDWMISMLYDMINQVENFVEMNSVKYADPIQWSITSQYEKNTIVVDGITGTAYISSKPVPMGMALSRTEYWSVIFDLGRFVTLASQNFANSYEAVLTTTATMPTDKDKWVVWNSLLYRAKNDIHVGDRYVIDGNIEKYTVEMFFDELAHLIAEETEARIEGDTNLHNEIIDESVARENADVTLQDNIDAEATARENTDNVLQGNIDTEATARENADDVLQGNIDAEATARENVDNVLQGNIDAEATARENVDNVLQGNIDAEATARENADNVLNARINNLSGYKDTFKNIRDYGAVGDGILHPLSEYYNSLDAARVDFPFAQSLTLSIDTAALQKAINNNLLVFAPAGTYIFNTSVILPQGKSVTIQGEDKMHTIFKSVVSSIPMIAFERVSGVSVFTITDVFFTCETGVTGVTAIYFHGLIDGSTRYEDNWITVQRCNFFYLKRALDLYTCSNIYVDHCYAVSTEIFAYLGRAASFAHFSNILTLLGYATIYAEDALEDGISNGLYCYDVIGVFNTNLTFRVHGWQAVYIQNCSADFQGGVDGGYFIYGCQDVTINGCWCAGTNIAASDGIRLWNSYNVHVSDCTIEHFNRGIRVDAPAYCGNTVSNNVFLANITIDISVHNGSGVVITGNTFRSGATPIHGYDGTSHNIADNNIMIGTTYDMGLGTGSLVDRNVYI